MDAGLTSDPIAWVRAVHAWDPNATIAGRAAAHLTFAPDLAVTEIEVYRAGLQSDRGPLRFRRHLLNPELTTWVGSLRVATPEASALTAALAGDYDPATIALRKSMVSVASLSDAARLLATRPAHRLRTVLRDVSNNPWSVAEVRAHRLLRRAGIGGWIGNYPIAVDGQVLTVDIAIPEARVAIEVNSFEFHSQRAAMERDAFRSNALLSIGWRPYVLTPRQIAERPDETINWLRSVAGRRALRSRATQPPAPIRQ